VEVQPIKDSPVPLATLLELNKVLLKISQVERFLNTLMSTLLILHTKSYICLSNNSKTKMRKDPHLTGKKGGGILPKVPTWILVIP